MQLIQLFIPIFDPQRKPFPREWFSDIKTEMTARFGGLTVYQRSPATGLWKEDTSQTAIDEIVVYEVMARQIDLDFWKSIKDKLEKQFQQKQILIRYSEINLIS